MLVQVSRSYDESKFGSMSVGPFMERMHPAYFRRRREPARSEINSQPDAKISLTEAVRLNGLIVPGCLNSVSRQYAFFKISWVLPTLVSSALVAFAQELPPDFAKLSFQEGRAALVHEEERIPSPLYISNLVDQIESRALGEEKKASPVYLLGLFCGNQTNLVTTSVVAALVDQIDLKAVPDPKGAAQRWGSYPAEEALYKIGEPAVGAVINQLASETNLKRRHLLCEPMVSVNGSTLVVGHGWRHHDFDEVKGKTEARRQINERLNQEKEPSTRVNLEATLDEIEKWKPRLHN